MSLNDKWITWNLENVVWLPSKYQPSYSAIVFSRVGRTVGIGVESRKVWMCTLNVTVLDIGRNVSIKYFYFNIIFYYISIS